jgi:hypothetical protein
MLIEPCSYNRYMLRIEAMTLTYVATMPPMRIKPLKMYAMPNLSRSNYNLRLSISQPLVCFER